MRYAGRVPFKTRNQFVAGMGVTRKVGLVLAMIAISTIQLNSNDINSIFARDNNEQIDRADLVPLQDDEVWLIVPIIFNDNDENTGDEAVLEMEIREMMEGRMAPPHIYDRQALEGLISIMLYLLSILPLILLIIMVQILLSEII